MATNSKKTSGINPKLEPVKTPTKSVTKNLNEKGKVMPKSGKGKCQFNLVEQKNSMGAVLNDLRPFFIKYLQKFKQ